jgi:leader peptidase (prepilin peptidase)/N-methyltransferase
LSPFELPRELQLFWWGAVGLCVGSFLNVAIYRLPRDDVSVARPARSFCPTCKRQLSWYENIPVLSWLIQGARCRGCKQPISVRYPLVELLTAALWVTVAWITPEGEWPLLLVRQLVISGLIVATFVDFDCFEIPDEVSIGGIVLAPLLSFAVPELHADSWLAHATGDAGQVTRASSLIACLAGMGVGGGILMAIGWAGERVFGREAMGFGDVKLLTGAGGFVGPGAILAALVIASFAGAFVGLANIVRLACFLRSRARARRTERVFARSLAAARQFGQMLPFGPYLALGTGIVLLDWDHVRAWWP